MIQFFFKGGMMMYPLLASSILVVAIIIDRLIYFRHAEVDEKDLFVKIKDKLRSSGPEEAVAYCEKVGGPVAAVLKSGLRQYRRGRDKIEDSFEREALIEVPRLRKFLPALNTVGSIATLMGFTGTVIGMIKAFNSIAGAGTTSPGIVAGGIAEALTTTAMGLIIAIIALVSFHYFTHRVDRIMLELEKMSRDLMDVMEEV
ncbi:MAG: MotA/TolQ/ExbB proton channel family protein [Elusimicrobiota bacterium]